MAAPQLPEIAHVIQLAVAPVFLLAGVGSIINVVAGRLARIIDRARVLESELPGATGEHREALYAELFALSRRARWVNVAMLLAVLCALLVSVTIAMAFLDAFVPLNFAVTVAVTFVAAMFAFSGSLLAFLREIQLANATLRFGIVLAERHGPR